ncbi:beta-Ala-His dipeptidase [Stecheria intestinalis]|uniref:beta-Ala-His dipeptidase n=1 Tax=Stecheria intestinalis TaxID=2606630 RepID=UPI0023EFE1E8|nr:beta-Ala-His dipeptidase [Stecheria intestinalis]MDD5881785.1 beta-Ala-His dipeptidase [Stecheria intestinalis]
MQDDSERPIYWFRKISEIPRPSYHEKAISDFIVKFAEEHGLKAEQDEVWNVIVEKPASAGYEQVPALILQGHMDMVPQKRPGSDHDFRKDPIRLKEENGLLKAEDTTLGADDGLGVAWMLAVLEDDTLIHPRLECLFTVQEEVGLGGAMHLKPEAIRADRLLSLDCCSEGITDLCCAGGQYAYMDAKLNWIANESAVYEMQIGGLKGGHSGADIHRERGNAVCIAARIAEEMIRNGIEVRAISLNCDEKANAIPRTCSFRFASFSKEPEIRASIQKSAEKISEELHSSDPGFSCIVSESKPEEKAADEVSTKNLLDFIWLAPQGFQHRTMDPKLNGLTVTSLNAGTAETFEDRITVTWLIRSMFDSASADLLGILKTLASRCKVGFRYTEFFPGWQYAEHSELREIYAEVMKKQGRELKAEAEHGGLEVGIFAALHPGLDICTLGADCRYYHTYDEELDLASFRRGYQTLRGIIAECAEKGIR